ncbi:glycoside hydrolase family 18 protein [Alkalihalophilus marmarensis]|uniref:Spore germination protein n=1 Tax=Alkalihalophilus marmarensis DSM 21297 TaxID=1188261 RepID=U6SPY8_9BACI|nr:glycoside hydrolase family 18 protein [Alkalihalophilus marmarensis]ERN53688.1 spore germination protein [Alkalihalophilus marmarensis DSM 21297]
MQIHVVVSGDSVWSIARQYEIPYQMIVDANQLENADQLVVGQALVIPSVGRFHWLQPGENIWEVSQRYHIPPELITQVNQIHSTRDVHVWKRLYIPTEYRQKPAIDVGGYIDLNITGEDSANVVGDKARYLTFVMVFSYEMNYDGTLRPIDDQAIINTAYSQNAIPLMVITNIEDGGFSTELATAILQDEQLQDRLLDEAIAIMEEKGYLGLDFDLEYLGSENREAYNNLMRKAKERLDEKGFYLSSALAPQVEEGMEGVLYEGHDYRTHGEIADFVFLMTYEWGWTGGPPRAVAPIDQVRRVIEFAASQMPNDKIMMGIPLYGYDWTLPFVAGQSRARAIDHQEAIRLAATYNAAIEYDQTAQSPYFRYVDEQGRQHEVWFDDARSIQAKFDLVKEFGLRGLFYWVLGWDFPQNWLLLEDNFTINKRV